MHKVVGNFNNKNFIGSEQVFPILLSQEEGQDFLKARKSLSRTKAGAAELQTATSKAQVQFPPTSGVT